MIVVTHYQRLLNYIVPDFVHVLFEGRIVKSGGKELALELEQKGYDWIEARAGEPVGRTSSADMRMMSESHRQNLLAGFAALDQRRDRDGRGLAPTGAGRRLRRARVSDDAGRGLAVHERRADRAKRFQRAGPPSRSRRG